MSLQDKIDDMYDFSFEFRIDGRSFIKELLENYFLYNYNRDKSVFEIRAREQEKDEPYRASETFYEELMRQDITIRSATEAELGAGVLGQYDPRSNTILLLYSLAADEMRRTRDHEMKHYERMSQGMKSYDRGKEEDETRRATGTLEPGYA
ncbi:hypothetical protein HY500_00160 [Candidatus Woesearchaeota archaeon]|nr:hypothetical protein [Candidatus Woesearchaeota archaeon]